MHDDLCMATATSRWNSKLVLHCWRLPHPPAIDHHDMDFGVYWRHAPQAAPAPSKRRRLFKGSPTPPELVMT